MKSGACGSMATISQPFCYNYFSPTLYTRNQINATKASSSSPYSEEQVEKTRRNEKKIEIRVCTNRTCRRQGSFDTLHVLSGISPPNVSVTSCGCLGRCGSGPNVVVLPRADFFNHCGTPTKAANLMLFVLEDETDSSSSSSSAAAAVSVEDKCKKCLEALALRKRAQDEMGRGNFSLAQHLLSQAIDLKPFGGVHIIYKDRCATRLAMGDISEALEDAKASLALAPKYSEGYICQGDALMAMDQIDAAEESYQIALELDPSVRHSKSFKARIAKLSEKFAHVNSD